jgi:hypothetical protein
MGEEKKAETIAISMLQNEEPIEKISRFTGLSLDRVTKLALSVRK